MHQPEAEQNQGAEQRGDDRTEQKCLIARRVQARKLLKELSNGVHALSEHPHAAYEGDGRGDERQQLR